MSFAQRLLRNAIRSPAVSMRMFATESTGSGHGIGSAQKSFLNKEDVTARVLDAVKRFPKVNAAKVTATSSFTNDLGLDSLDQVELVMSFEDEFRVEIPDADAEKLQSVEDAIKFIAAHPTAL